MTYDEAKKAQIEEFYKGRYYVLRETSPGEFTLVMTVQRKVAEESMIKDAIAVVKRIPTRLRVIKGDSDAN